MGVFEKRVPRNLSIAAMAVSVGFTGWLWVAGLKEPREYVASMDINHHGGYGSTLNCRECHVATGGMFSLHTELNCISSGCHGALHPDTSKEKAFELAVEKQQPYPDAKARARHFLDLHNAVEGQECWDCHTEHTTDPTVVPEGWQTYEELKRERSTTIIDKEYRSLSSLIK